MDNSADYTFSFESYKSPNRIFELLLNVQSWWNGLFAEHFTGNSTKLNDEFTFSAGDGAHYSKQKLVELIPDEKIVWEVTESNLSFLELPSEWTGTKLRFDILKNGSKTLVRFTHEGLVSSIECYQSCTDAWSQYLRNLAKKLK